MAAHVEITGPQPERYVEILSPRALELLGLLHRALAGRRAAVLDDRWTRQARLSGGGTLDFLPETGIIRDDPAWRVARPAPGLAGWRTGITGPAGRAATVTALNSGADLWLADFADATPPLWTALIEGQLNLKDALDRLIDFTGPDGQSHVLRPDEELATIVVRPRGWHLDEKHIVVDGQRASGSLTDFALYLSACGQRQLDKGKGPYFLLPQLESHREARLWNDAFVLAQDFLGLPRGTIRALAAIETITAAFEMDEILYELREHGAGLSTGRPGYLLSVIRAFRARGRDFVLPDRDAVTASAPFLRACRALLVRTCHQRGAVAAGDTATVVPAVAAVSAAAVPAAAVPAVAAVREDKAREAAEGFDGSWVAHPDLVPACRAAFAAVPAADQAPPRPAPAGPAGPAPARPAPVTAAGLLAVAQTPGGTTEGGLRGNISVALQYLAAWLGGTGTVTIFGQLTDLATAELARAQVWQWVRAGVVLDDGSRVTKDVVERMIDEELGKLVGDGFDTARYGQAVALFTEVALADSFTEFLTRPAYERMP